MKYIGSVHLYTLSGESTSSSDKEKIVTKSATDTYRDNYDRIFGKKDAPKDISVN